MFTVSHRTLTALAGLTWYVGGFSLLAKGIGVLVETSAMYPGEEWPFFAGIAGPVVGAVKARYLYMKSCRKNLARIRALENPKVWQFFRPWFFAALAMMILTGMTLSSLAQGFYTPMIIVGLVDLSLAVGLLGSSNEFWTDRARLLSIRRRSED